MGSDDDDHGIHRSLPRVSHRVTLAAVSSLFALTLLVILLFLYAKYRQNRTRRSRRISFVSRLVTVATGGVTESPDGAARKNSHGGLDPDVVRALPEFAYKPPASPADAAVECAVCLAGMTEGVKVRLLPNCGHTFHVECVDEWLASHTTCPLCRAEVEPCADAEKDEEETPVVAEPSPEPTAPSVDEISLLNGAEPSAPPVPESKGSGGSRLSSFRRKLSRERTSSSMRSLEDCGDQVSPAIAVPQLRDLERQS